MKITHLKSGHIDTNTQA